jgi:hypothetical protein
MGRNQDNFQGIDMHIRRPSRPRQGPGNRGDRQGDTVPAQGEVQQPVARAPHERDESADRQARGGEASARRVAEQGRSDVERGLVDTDKGPALEEAYDKVRAGTPEADKKLRR